MSTTWDEKEALGPLKDWHELRLAWLLAGLAGSIGAVVFLYSANVFVTFQTGNTERAADFLIHGEWQRADNIFAIIASFVFGAFVATIARIKFWNKAKHGAVIITTCLSALAAVIDIALVPEHTSSLVSVCLLSTGLGALNTSFSKNGETTIPLSYMTGELMKVGQGIALHVVGARKFVWFSHATVYSAFFMGSLVAGALFLQVDYGYSLGICVAFSVVCSLITWRFDHSRYSEKMQEKDYDLLSRA